MDEERTEQGPLASLRVDQAGETVRASLFGELDMSNGDLMARQILQAAQGSRIVDVDLSRLCFIDSSGIAALERLRRTLDGNGTIIRISAAADSAAGRTLRVAGMAQIWQLNGPTP